MIRYNEIPVRDYKVLVRCMTYNQCEYIEDALNGFVIQQTSFPFVCLVMDDASTDGEQEVIKDWMAGECDMPKAERYDIPEAEVVVVPHRSNDNCTMAFFFLKKNMYGGGQKDPLLTHWREHCEYETICEGDDYWIAEDKLQKQVDVLENDPEVALCYTKAKIYDQKSHVFTIEGGGEYIDYQHLLVFNPIMTLTTMYRITDLRQYFTDINPAQNKWVLGDTPLWLYLAAHGKLSFLQVCTAVYRYLPTSVSHSNNFQRIDRYNSSLRDIRLFYNDKYNKGEQSLQQAIWNDYYKRNVVWAIQNKSHSVFLEYSPKEIVRGFQKVKYFIFRSKILFYLLISTKDFLRKIYVQFR